MQYIKISNQFTILTVCISILLSLPKLQCCPYSEYEDALLPIKSQYAIYNLNLNEKDSFEFGFWSLCVPQQTFKNIPTIDQEYNKKQSEDGQLLFLVKGNCGYSVKGIVLMSLEPIGVYHKIIIKESEAKVTELYFFYDSIIYEGKWILNIFTLNFIDEKIYVEMSNQLIQSSRIGSHDMYQSIIQGGRGLIENLNLNIFRGRLSKILIRQIQFQVEPLLQYMNDNCQVPRPLKEEQTIYLVKGLLVFEGDKSLNYIINQFGTRYCLSGWIKYDASRVIEKSIYPLIRISLFKNYFQQTYFGDELFSLKAHFDRLEPKLSKIEVWYDFHLIPIMGELINYTLNSMLIEFEDEFSNHYFEGLQQWHYLHYEQGTAQYTNLLYIQFFNEIQLVTNQFILHSTSNSPFYLYLGTDEYFIDLLQASLYDFKFEYNYLSDKQFFFNVCHYTCQTCDGPLENNCLNCETNTNRHYLSELKKCQCNYGFLDITDQKICIAFEFEYSSVEQQEGYHISDSYCEFGYFHYPKESDQFQCVKCPQSNFQNILCIDCIYYPLTWYLKPICKYDLNSEKLSPDDAYKYEQRDQFNYDFYLINQDKQIQLNPGFMDFCDIESDTNCFKAKYQHLGKDLYVRCKPNYFSENGDCFLTNINCLQASSTGNCLKTKIGMYQRDGYFYQCPLTCLKCENFHDSNTLQCQSCIDGYALDNGNCVSCGNFCSFCQKFYDENIGKDYLKCYKCLDDSKYFLSFDGVNCFKNDILYCQYAFQAQSNDLQINTLDLYFTPRNDWHNIITVCGRCQHSYVLIMETNSCLLQADEQCFFSYAERFNNSTNIDIYIMIEMLMSEQYVKEIQGELISVAFNPIDFNLYVTSIQYCLIRKEYDIKDRFKIVQFNRQCPIYVENCETCLRQEIGLTGIIHVCLLCKQGYYADRLSGKCFLCPTQLNCQYCIQRQKLSKDFWKLNIRAFYQFFINSNNDHSFKAFAQSENKNDYEIICTFCIKGYEIFNDNCIKQCPESCLECKYLNGQNQCIKCYLEFQGRKLSLSENQCIECPQNCALCRIRSKQEILSINPLFNNDKYITNTYQCLKSFDDQEYFFDQQLGSFINCIQFKNCVKQYLIPINLYCSLEDFQISLNALQNSYEKSQFKIKNIFLDDLISGSSFKEFENDEFYSQANSNLIKTIILNIVSIKPQICKIKGQATIKQNFSQNIFSNINVELSINFNENTIIEYERTITFLNFNKITIFGGKFQPIENDHLKQLIFSSVFFQMITLDTIIYQQISFENDKSQIIFNNVKELNLINLQIINLTQNNTENFILITDTSYTKKIKLQIIEIMNSTLKNQKTLFFNINQQDIIEINDLFVKGKFQNTTLIETNPWKNLGNFFINNMKAKVDLVNCEPFLNLVYFNDIRIMGILFEHSLIDNSTLIIINNNNNLSNLTLKDSKFGEFTQGIINSNQLFDEDFSIEFYNSVIENIEYHYTAKFINFNKYNNRNTSIIINNLIIQNNYMTQTQLGLNFNGLNICLIYIQLDFVEISMLNIYRGFGLKIISIHNAKFLRITSSFITQSDEFKFLGLHQYVDCQIQEVKGDYYLQSLFLTSVDNLQIIDMQIKSVQSYNSPIIYYKSSDTITQQQLITIHLSNFFVESNLLLLTNQTYFTAIIFIESIQQTILKVSNITFIGNILHEYVQNNLQISSLLLNFNCILGVITITDSFFSKNTLYNSTDNIIYIKSQQLKLLNSKFYQNSYFNYQVMQPVLFWGFKDSEKLSYQEINNIFQVKSKSGIGQFLIEKLDIKFCYFEQSVGLQGGSLYIEAQKNSIITISQSQFKNISTTFSKDLGFGGSIYLDGSTSDSLQLTINNLIINDIMAKEYGGFLYLKSDSPIISISVYQLDIQNIYSKLGSFIYIVFSTISYTIQEVKIDSIFIKNEKDKFSNYLNQYTQLSNLDEITLINNRALFYFDSVINLYFENIQINSILLESAIIIKNAQIVSLNNFKVINSLINYCLFQLHPNLYESNQIQITNVQVYNITITKEFNSYNCEQQQTIDYTIYFQCIHNDQSKKAPLNLKFYQKDLQFSYGDCILSQIQQQLQQGKNQIIDNNNSGLFLFLDLTQLTQIKLNNLIFQQINCKSCMDGLIFYSFKKVEDLILKQYVSNLKVSNSSCGDFGCFQIKKENAAQYRFLMKQEINVEKLNLEVIIDNYICLFNNAKNGTCLYLDNIKVLISNSIFKYNNASEVGGAIFVKMKKNVLIRNSVISNNTALIGGGIYLIDQQDMDYLNLETYINNNQAEFFGNNVMSVPQQMTITFQDENSKFPTIQIQKKQDLLIQQVVIQLNGSIQNYFFLPSGQKISLFKKFSITNRTYSLQNQKFRLIALSKDNSIIKNLNKSFCYIDSRILNISEYDDEKYEFSQDFTNIDVVNFNEQTQDYNLDDLIVYFDNELPSDIVLQLQFRCNSIFVPNYNEQYPYNLQSTHSNYKLRIQIKTLLCQYGEIKNYTDFSCIPCDSNQGLYSLTLNQQKCELKDEISTISVKSALLNLKQGYWRPYFESNLISYCLNLPGNCLGGWIEGHESCFLGHIGALCEQCDLYNIRGAGQYSISKKFTCGLCTENYQNIVIITLVSIWTLVSIFISVQSTLIAIKEFFRNFCLSSMGLAVSQNRNQSAILIKMLTNYLQIIGSLATFQLQLPNGFEDTFTAMGSPIQAMTYSLDCFLSDAFHIEIQYARIIWQIIMPSIYITFFFHWYMILIFQKRTTFNKCVITTTFIYMYIYLQPSIIGGLVQLISYRQISGYKWIQSNVSSRYDTNLHGQWMIRLCLPLLLIFAIFIPVFFFYKLFRNSANLNQKNVRLQFGYLYNEYTGSAYFWEVIKIAQKELIIIFLAYFEDFIVIKATIILLITGLYLELNQKYKPYKLKALNLLDQYSTNVCLASIVLAIGLYVAQQSNSIEVQIPYQIIIIVLNLHIIYLLISKIIVEYLNEKTSNYQDTLDQLRFAIRKLFPQLTKIRFLRRILADRKQKKIRITIRYLKLKNFLIPQAKEILILKRQSNQITIERNLDSNANTQHLSLRSPNLYREGQQLIRNPNLDNSLNISKAKSYVFETQKQDQIHQAITLDGNQQSKLVIDPISLQKKYNKSIQEG
ncbi:unnamed protein product [Paramecium sonneborni]|uniref:Transmembrane protein n=1 Tax=Paramecium sonneborni TaxID=65129 RepID=A0A8S1QNE6_9CILI|nr:unnamed protein product [Paramecium sonneborni]